MSGLSPLMSLGRGGRVSTSSQSMGYFLISWARSRRLRLRRQHGLRPRAHPCMRRESGRDEPPPRRPFRRPRPRTGGTGPPRVTLRPRLRGRPLGRRPPPLRRQLSLRGRVGLLSFLPELFFWPKARFRDCPVVRSSIFHNCNFCNIHLSLDTQLFYIPNAVHSLIVVFAFRQLSI